MRAVAIGGTSQQKRLTDKRVPILKSSEGRSSQESGDKMAKRISWPVVIFLAASGWVFGYQYEFGKPLYDSGWVAFAQHEIKYLTHNLGGNINHYVVDMQFRDSGSNRVNQIFFGGRDGETQGAWWDKLTTSDIRVSRGEFDGYCDEIRVRIWQIAQANFNSGWRNISQGQNLVLTHNIGGNPDDYVVYLEFKDNESYGIHQRSYGGPVFGEESAGPQLTPVSVGACWTNLDGSAIKIFRCPDDGGVDQIRVRIWKAGHPDYDSGWQAAGTDAAVFHNLGGPWNDYVVDLQFKDTDLYGVNQRFYGGAPLGGFEPGAYWHGLNASQVSVLRQGSVPHIDQVRVRIWRCAAPKYDSGWLSLSPASSQVMIHGLGGNPDDYVVDLEFKDSVFSINNYRYGGRKCYSGGPYANYQGAYWYGLNNNQITVYRSESDSRADQVRVRIWLAPGPDFDSGWQPISAGSYLSLSPTLNNDDDCVVYLEFKNASGGIHHIGYGGDKWWDDNTDVLSLYGAYWDSLSPTTIRVNRQQNDTLVSQARVRIWKNDPTPAPRYAWKDDWTGYEHATPTIRMHALGGDVDDYVLDMRFRTTGLISRNHLFYGSIYAKHESSGAHYQFLNTSSVEIVRALNDGAAAQIMLRIWNTGYTPKTVYVSGHVSFAGNPLPGVAVSFSGAGGGTCYTNSSGYYSMSLPSNYSGTATPSLTGYLFTPDHQDYSSLTAHATTDYTASPAPSITVTAPNGGEFWAVGSSRNITWTLTGASANVKIEYSSNSGSSYSLITASTPNDGTYAWTVPNTVSATCLVKVCDAAAPSFFDVSDAPFAIVSIPEKRLSWTSGHSGDADIAVEASGKVHVVWQDNTPGNFEIYYKKSPDGGATWAGAKKLTFTAGSSRAPAIAVDPSLNLHVVWADDTPGNFEVYYKKSTDGGATWTANKRLSMTADSSDHPFIAVDSAGDLHVVWQDNTPGNEEVFYAKSTDKGAAWSAARRLTWTPDESEDPAIGVESSGFLHLVWGDETPGNSEIYHKKSTDGGATWSVNKRLTWNSGGSVGPKIAVDPSGCLHVVWPDHSPGNYEIYYKNSPDGGATWTTNNRLTWNSSFSLEPVMAADSSGHLHVVFMDNAPENFEIFYRKSVDGGVTWTTNRRLTWSIYAQGSPALDVDSSANLHIVWECMAPGNYEIFFMKFK